MRILRRLLRQGKPGVEGGAGRDTEQEVIVPKIFRPKRGQTVRLQYPIIPPPETVNIGESFPLPQDNPYPARNDVAKLPLQSPYESEDLMHPSLELPKDIKK